MKIKFKVWDGEKIISLNEAIKQELVVIEVPSSDKSGEIEINYDGVVLLQYTGLKDKNNKEIYIGDIVAYKNKDINDNLIEDRFIVKFGKYDNDMYYEDNISGYGVYMENYMLIRNNKIENLEKEIFDFEGFWGIDELEVIGNVYDNPKLLKEV